MEMAKLGPKRILYLLGVLLWAVVLLILALQPNVTVTRYLPTSFLRNMAHLTGYGILAFLLCLYLRFKKKVLGIRMKLHRALSIAFILASAWGIGTECVQRYSVDRTFEGGDIVFDMVGALLAVIYFWVWSRGHRFNTTISQQFDASAIPSNG